MTKKLSKTINPIVITIVFLVMFIIVFNVIRINLQTSRKDNFINSLNTINGNIRGKVINKHSFEDKICLLKLKLDENNIGNIDLNEFNLYYLTIKGMEAEIALTSAKSYCVGDSIIVDSNIRKVINFRNGDEVHAGDFKSVFVYKFTPGFYDLKGHRELMFN